MKNIILVTLISLFFISCSTVKKKSLIEMDGAQKMNVPEWVYAPQSGCEESKEICASAEGENSTSADVNARNSLGSIFESNVKSNFLIEKFGYSNAEASALTERVASEVSETVNVVLNSVTIKSRFKKDGLSFSLASLNRLKAAKSLSEEIKTLDDKIEYLYKEGNKSSIIKMHLLFDKREQINQKIIVVTGNPIKTQMSFSKINKIKYQKKTGNRIIVKSINTVPRTLKKWIESLLTDSGYKVVEDSNIDYIVKIKYFANEEFMKVKGFKKFSFSIIIESKNNTGDKLGVLKIEEIGVGRTEQNAYLKTKTKLQDQIKRNLNKINLK